MPQLQLFVKALLLNWVLLDNFIGRFGWVRGLGNEACMENYEIRILKKGRKPVIYAGPHTSDYAAVRCAQSLAAKDDHVEVWRDLDCVYSTGGARASL